jgi:uncharacterized protein
LAKGVFQRATKAGSVQPHTSSDQTDAPTGNRESRLEHLHRAIEHAAHLLPAQGPINVFVHHNTLHAFEDLNFDEAVQKGSKVFGCHPYLPEDRYRAELARGRILASDLRHVLHQELTDRADEQVLPFVTRFELRMAMMQHPMRLGPDAELRWFVAVTDALTQIRDEVSGAAAEQFVAKTRRWVMRDVHGPGVADPNGRAASHDRRIHNQLKDVFQHFGESRIESWSPQIWMTFGLHALWRACRDGVHGVKQPPRQPSSHVRHRDLLREATAVDTDPLVHDLLIRFCASFLDQGFSQWNLPLRDLGFYRSFATLYRQVGGPPTRWLRGLAKELQRLDDLGASPLDSVLESLDELGVHDGEWNHFLSDTLLALRGWAGMIRQVESRGDRAAHPIREGSLVEFLAVHLLLERLALTYVAGSTLQFRGPLSELRHVARSRLEKHPVRTVDQRAFLVFQLAQIFGWSPDEMYRLNGQQWAHLVEEVEAFPSLEQRRVFHHAYERSFRNQTLDAMAIHQPHAVPKTPPRFQAMFCIDDREESFRRHLEELAPDCETFGVAGFFGVAMYYRGTEDAHYVPLCPIVIRPQHWVEETVAESLEDTHRKRAKARRAIGTASHQFHVGSRSFAGGALLAAGVGVLASIPLVGRIMFPRLTAHIRRRIGHYVKSPELTELALERTEATPGATGGHLGFSIEEMANITERLLRDIGLVSGFSRLVLVIGHGSNSLNNPHKSAYDCGACGGGAGGPNARATAQMANDPRVRALIAQRGVIIPNETIFVGGLHNTCDDSVTLFDIERIPSSHREEFQALRRILDNTCARNAHERCRRFQSASLTMSFDEALRHVEERSEDLAQTRPECGHATNAICVVGRRARTRGLFLDRRAFLTSYDPKKDDADATILSRILGAVFPVCAGINLEYYFSYVDNTGFGCGVKLPHNVTGLLGVMDGAASDLRTGLPWQMVEIHEPVRLLFVIETTPALMHGIMERNEGIRRLCYHRWIQLATLDPDSSQIHFFRNGEFQVHQPEASQLPRAASSVDWYRGWREHLEFAEIED